MSDNPILVVPPLCGPIPAGGAQVFAPRGARRFCASVPALVAAADVLFYAKRPGISVGIFGLIAMGVLALNRRRSRWDGPRWLMAVLIAAALAQSVVETGFCNAIALFCMFSVAMVDAEARTFGARFAGLGLAADSWIRSLARWRTFFSAAETAVGGGKDGDTFAVRVMRGIGLALPAAALLIPFAVLIGTGNAIMGESFSRIAAWLASVEFPSVGRCAFWAVTATGAMTFLAPTVRGRVAALWMTPWPTFPAASNGTAALWRTWLMLGSVNVLFLWANTLDAVYLWVHTALPAGVSYSRFVHAGVSSLSAATVLAGVALAWIFQQDRSVSRNRATVGLALGWVVQNLILLASVALRLKLYVEAYQLTVARLGVLGFLALVAAGFGLLAWRILAGRSLNWLILSNAAAVFGLFYALQFVDLAGIVARYNAGRWLAHESLNVDVAYLSRLGAPAWPSLKRVANESLDVPTKLRAKEALARAERNALRAPGWQSWQWREAALRKEVFSK